MSKLKLQFSLKRLLITGRWVIVVCLALFMMSAASPVHAQFISGSNGSDGAFAPTSNVTVQLDDDGVFHYTTINIPAGVTVRFTRNARNTPVVMLAQGNVTINGAIVIDGVNAQSLGGDGGPGGFNGGVGGAGIVGFTLGTTGDGPGGGRGASSATGGGGDNWVTIP